MQYCNQQYIENNYTQYKFLNTANIVNIVNKILVVVSFNGSIDYSVYMQFHSVYMQLSIPQFQRPNPVIHRPSWADLMTL